MHALESMEARSVVGSIPDNVFYFSDIFYSTAKTVGLNVSKPKLAAQTRHQYDEGYARSCVCLFCLLNSCFRLVIGPC